MNQYGGYRADCTLPQEAANIQTQRTSSCQRQSPEHRSTIANAQVFKSDSDKTSVAGTGII
jgi:hypothetical protein